MGLTPANADKAAEWLIAGVLLESERVGSPLSDRDVELLAMSVLRIGELDRTEMISLNNRVVKLARSAMEHEKASGAETVKPRRGLRLPADWVGAYQVAFAANNDQMISAIMQNAMLQNPMAGERKKWKSK